MTALPPIPATRQNGDAPFRGFPAERPRRLIDFWQWAFSDVVCNVTRGLVAEYLVAVALGCDDYVRDIWQPYDLLTRCGQKIEVKSAAYIQSWSQAAFSNITFTVRPTLAWEAATNRQATHKQRQADLYVRCLLHHQEQDTLNPLDGCHPVDVLPAADRDPGSVLPKGSDDPTRDLTEVGA